VLCRFSIHGLAPQKWSSNVFSIFYRQLIDSIVLAALPLAAIDSIAQLWCCWELCLKAVKQLCETSCLIFYPLCLGWWKGLERGERGGGRLVTGVGAKAELCFVV